jgi:hypothetical protein
MIWLTWRRHRIVLILVLLALAAVGVWMFLVAHWWTVASDEEIHLLKLCGYLRSPANARNSACVTRKMSESSHFFLSFRGTFSISRQATAINLILLTIPCLIGIALGAPLVAGEITHLTNRLAWTQGVSRTRWFVLSWLAIAVPLAIVVGFFCRFEWWWSFHAYFGTTYMDRMWEGHVSPPVFPTSGFAPVAYTLFAFSLGAVMGAAFRRVSLAAVGTAIIYVGVSLLMVTTIRPVLAPRVFILSSDMSYGYGIPDFDTPWKLGPAYRFAPDYKAPDRLSASAVGIACLNKDPNSDGNQDDSDPIYLDCLAANHVQNGYYWMPNSSFWPLQWRESGIYLVLTGAIFGLSIWSVRRWQE